MNEYPAGRYFYQSSSGANHRKFQMTPPLCAVFFGKEARLAIDTARYDVQRKSGKSKARTTGHDY
jgi:hypothetical protein